MNHSNDRQISPSKDRRIRPAKNPKNSPTPKRDVSSSKNNKDSAVERFSEDSAVSHQRSSRTPTPPKRLIFNMFSLIIFMYLVAQAFAAFERVNPVLRRKSEKQVIIGKRHVTLSVCYEKPCDVFLSADPNATSLELMRQWCEKATFDHFVAISHQCA